MKLADFFRKFSSKTYLVVAFTGVTTTPVIMLSLIQYSFLNSNIISLMENNHITIVENMADKFSNYIKLNIQSVNYLSSQIKNKNINDVKTVFNNFNANYPEYKAIYYYDKKNIYFYQNGRMEKASDSFFKRYYILENSIASKNTFIIDRMELPNKSDCIGIVNPIYEKDYKGLLLACLDLEQMKNYINQSSGKEKVVIVNKSDNTVVYPKNQDISFIDEDLLKEIKLNEKGVVQNYSVRDKNQKAVSYSSLENPNWLVLYEYPLSDYRNELIKFSIRMLIASLISLGFALIMGLWIAYYQHRFARNILSAIREVAKGNYKKKVKSELILIPNEFDQMIKEFNNMEEKIEQLDSFKSNLIDTVSHEFRTPLTSIKGFSATLLRKDVTFDAEMQRKLLKIISAQSDRLSRMVEDLLVVPKLEGNVLKLNLQEIELEPIIEHISEFFPDDKFEIKIREQIWILVDPDRFEQVILNLFENAHKYSNPKGTKVKIRGIKEENFAHIIVSNASEKVPSEKLDTLFDKFVRLDDALTRTTGGTGLGLFITKGLVELMNGKIWLESTKDEFRVHFTVPIAEE